MLLHIRGMLEPQYVNAMQSRADAIPLSTVRNQPSEVVWAQGAMNAENEAEKGVVKDPGEILVEDLDYLSSPTHTPQPERTGSCSTSEIK